MLDAAVAKTTEIKKRTMFDRLVDGWFDNLIKYANGSVKNPFLFDILYITRHSFPSRDNLYELKTPIQKLAPFVGDPLLKNVNFILDDPERKIEGFCRRFDDDMCATNTLFGLIAKAILFPRKEKEKEQNIVIFNGDIKNYPVVQISLTGDYVSVFAVSTDYTVVVAEDGKEPEIYRFD